MFTNLHTIFWFLFWLIVYVYIGYPCLMAVLVLIRPRAVQKDVSYEPRVTLVTAAFNEEAIIEEAIRNKLALDYPKEKLEYIIISDASTDETESIVERLSDEVSEYGTQLKLLKQPERMGKTTALNRAVAEATGDIIVNADANSMYDQGALRALVSNFADHEVGYVTGKMVYVTKKGASVSEGCGAYMIYENLLRAIETRIGSIVGVDGGIDAWRKDLYSELDPADLPDFVLPLRVIEQKHRVVYEEQAIVREEALETNTDEFNMRVRVSLRAYRTLLQFVGLMNPFLDPLYALQLVSHKVLRYGVGLALIGFFALSFVLAPESGAYDAWFKLQLMFYVLAAVGAMLESQKMKIENRKQKIEGNPESILHSLFSILYSLTFIPYYFCLINFAALIALVKLLKGDLITTWTPRKG